MFINFSNHPSALWSVKQRVDAEKYGDIMDLAFPIVAASADENTIGQMANEITERILAHHPDAVMCQGEFGLTYAVVSRLKARNVRTVYACSERQAQEETAEEGATKRVLVFKFVRFRCY